MADCKDCIYSVELNYNEETKYKVECKVVGWLEYK
jgi:hypothetical protein